MTAPMMRARQTGRPCRVPGHGSLCEVSEERAAVGRAQENREWRREVRSLQPGEEGSAVTDRDLEFGGEDTGN